MSRQIVSVFAMSIFLITSSLQASGIKPLRQNTPEPLDIREDQCQLLNLFYELFKEGSLGRDPERKERAAWIVQNSEGKFELIFWPRSVQRNQQDWNGPIPRNMVAQAHVHTVVADPKPSSMDKEVAKKFNAIIYTLHVKGIFRVTPQGEITREADAFWYKKISGCTNAETPPDRTGPAAPHAAEVPQSEDPTEQP